MHTVSGLANHDYLKIESILSEPVTDIYAYLQYQNAKALAEKAQFKFDQERENRKRK